MRTSVLVLGNTQINSKFQKVDIQLKNNSNQSYKREHKSETHKREKHNRTEMTG